MDGEGPGLDQVLGGGLFEAGLYLIEGPAGTGKTLLVAARQLSVEFTASLLPSPF